LRELRQHVLLEQRETATITAVEAGLGLVAHVIRERVQVAPGQVDAGTARAEAGRPRRRESVGNRDLTQLQEIGPIDRDARERAAALDLGDVDGVVILRHMVLTAEREEQAADAEVAVQLREARLEVELAEDTEVVEERQRRVE